LPLAAVSVRRTATTSGDVLPPQREHFLPAQPEPEGQMHRRVPGVLPGDGGENPPPERCVDHCERSASPGGPVDQGGVRWVPSEEPPGLGPGEGL
jgi:hypothetical protein